MKLSTLAVFYLTKRYMPRLNPFNSINAVYRMYYRSDIRIIRTVNFNSLKQHRDRRRDRRDDRFPLSLSLSRRRFLKILFSPESLRNPYVSRANVFLGDDDWSDHLFYARGFISLALRQAAGQDLCIFEDRTVVSALWLGRWAKWLPILVAASRRNPYRVPGESFLATTAVLCARLTHRQLLMLPFDLLSRSRRSTYRLRVLAVRFICSFAIRRRRRGREKWIVHWCVVGPQKDSFFLSLSLLLPTGNNAFIYAVTYATWGNRRSSNDRMHRPQLHTAAFHISGWEERARKGKRDARPGKSTEQSYADLRNKWAVLDSSFLLSPKRLQRSPSFESSHTCILPNRRDLAASITCYVFVSLSKPFYPHYRIPFPSVFFFCH